MNGWLYWGTLGSQRHTAIPDKDSHCGRARYPYCCTRAQCARYPDTGVRPPRTAILREGRHNTAIPPTYKCRSMAKYAYFNTTQTSPLVLEYCRYCKYCRYCRYGWVPIALYNSGCGTPQPRWNSCKKQNMHCQRHWPAATQNLTA